MVQTTLTGPIGF